MRLSKSAFILTTSTGYARVSMLASFPLVSAALVASRCQTNPTPPRLTSLSGTHCGSSREKGLLKAPFSGTMRRPLGLRTSFFPSGTADILLQQLFLLSVQQRPTPGWTHPPTVSDRPISQSAHWEDVTWCVQGCIDFTASMKTQAQGGNTEISFVSDC